VLPEAAATRGDAIAEGLHASFTLGVGQFCTNPGVVLLPTGSAGDALRDSLARLTERTEGSSMLNQRVCKAYGEGLDRLVAAGATRLAAGVTRDGHTEGVAALWEVDARAITERPELVSEVFGPSTLLVRYRDEAELLAFATTMEGQLTATLQGEPGELSSLSPLVE